MKALSSVGVPTMGKTGCPVCQKPYGAGHWSIVDCPQVKSEIKVEKIPTPKLTAPASSLTETESVPTGSLTDVTSSLTTPDGRLTETDNGSLTKQQRYRQAHPDWYRTYQREYMRRRRAE